jgi:hypothetical protein
MRMCPVLPQQRRSIDFKGRKGDVNSYVHVDPRSAFKRAQYDSDRNYETGDEGNKSCSLHGCLSSFMIVLSNLTQSSTGMPVGIYECQ